jgi:hypothetical protein
LLLIPQVLDVAADKSVCPCVIAVPVACVFGGRKTISHKLQVSGVAGYFVRRGARFNGGC